MSTEIDEMTAAMLAAGWKRQDIEPNARLLDALYVSDYGVLGLALRPSIDDVLATWADCQQQLSQTKKSQSPTKDMYLVFVVPEVNLARTNGLQTVVGDTHVCRKLCVERRDRPLRDVLMDTLLIPVADATESRHQQAPLILSASRLGAELLEDLTKQSPTVVFGNAIAGKYERNADPNAT